MEQIHLNNKSFGKKQNRLLRPALLVTMLGFGGVALAAAPTTGQLIVINGLANVVDATVGNSASSFSVVVSDATGPCSTTSTVAYGGTVTVKWNAAATHSTTVCTGITSVAITALKNSTGFVQYDSTANSTPPTTATAATTFTAPTTAITNLALVVTGGTSPATTGSATVWGAALGVAPIYTAGNGALTTTGIMGGVGSAGFKAARIMSAYAVTPMRFEG